MSLAKIKAKETKGKQKLLPKLKAILANPNKTKCPILDEPELHQLKSLIQNAIKESKLEPRSFATQKGICLGLESSLRKINNQTSSCVFISLSIKPNHIISLIARNAETKNETQPVYAQPKLENFIEELFGIQALCMVFPKNLMAISEELNKWVEMRKKPAKIKKVDALIKKTLKKKLKKIKPVENKKETKKELVDETTTESVVKSWSGDYISFDKDNPVTGDYKLDGDQAVEALSEIINKIPTSTTSKVIKEIEPMEVDADRNVKITAEINSFDDDNASENSDDFLGEYKNLTVHKIKGNPNKNPKKKRKKNKKKSTN
ncbi:hypothetical protein FF38_03489 [Lucilia cuprina]|uniref:Uncharacterized protein n=1 Tax=Lucilia cuprina TaxID=7375 RepID=A0A0L0CIT7_LUCCU|nr:hypothetical protein CVS40_0377 [Lucilia cuprina]KNC32166.1 hypothetical protein FF38_03489 [Lucilia cuprina]